MMSKEFLKKLGIVGITFGLAASPLAFADLHDEEPQDPVPHEEPAPDENFGSADDTFESTDFEASEYDTEYEEEEEEWTFDEEEEEEEQEWETPDEDDEESTW